MSPPSGVLDAWLRDLRTAALIGTSRREAPPPPAVLGLAAPAMSSREQSLLAGAAVAAVLARAGAKPGAPASGIEPAPDDDRPEAPAIAGQLLHLLLTQPPVGKGPRDELVASWLRAADLRGLRIPAALLPAVFGYVVAHRDAASALGGTLGARGRWLAACNPAWASFSGQGSREADSNMTSDGSDRDWARSWPTLPSKEAVESFASFRKESPEMARGMLADEWHSLSAKVRGDCVALLRHRLSKDDEFLLERALDDRAKTVREAALSVLDRLPTSARARRMAERLRPLVSVTGTLRRHLDVEVPEPPDADGVRDGLTASGGKIGPAPTVWLSQLVVAAPLSLWTDLTGKDVSHTLGMVRDQDVRRMLTVAAIRQRDRTWATALVATGNHEGDLLALLTVQRRRDLVMAAMGRRPVSSEAQAMLRRLPRPWDDELGRAVLSALVRRDADPHLGFQVAPLLSSALGRKLAPEIQAALDRLPTEEAQVRRVLTETLQVHSFQESIEAAFSTVDPSHPQSGGTS